MEEIEITPAENGQIPEADKALAKTNWFAGKKLLLLALLGFIVLASADGAGFYLFKKHNQNQTKNFDQKVGILQKQISGLQDKLQSVTGESASVAPPQKEIVNREVIHEQSQDAMLTSAVSKTAPAVVSIVISKDVPLLQVSYENPFGNDPFYKDFNIQVPVYKQVGTQKQKIGGGTGFIIRSNGYIVTNKHVVADQQADYTVLLSNGDQKPAQVVYRDTANDVAIIKIDGGNFPTVHLGDSNTLKLGQAVSAIGNALGEYNNSVSVGIISGLNRSIQASGPDGSENLDGVIQTDAAINPGNSGGPLMDLNGDVIGVNVATVQGSSNISFSIPINVIKSVIGSVLH